MSMNERIYKIDQLLAERQFITIDELLDQLEVSLATLKRDLAFMRDRLNAPIVFDKELGGYRLDRQTRQAGAPYELPGLWFSAEEIHALLTMHHLISHLDTGGLLGSHIQALQVRLTALLGAANDPVDEVKRRVKIEMVRTRHVTVAHFEAIGSALLKRKRIRIDHYSRSTNQDSQREISPQRLIFYHGNWYLDAWCHLRDDLRSFAVDTIQRVETLDKDAREVSDQRLDEVLTSGYGIFAGEQIQWAQLLFSPEVARWVAHERWHPDQIGQLLDDGSYQLDIPFSNDTELLMDVMRYGANVKVIGPVSLKNKVRESAESVCALYATPQSS